MGHEGRRPRDASARRLTATCYRASVAAIQPGVTGLAGGVLMPVSFDSLRASVSGGVVTPEDPQYEETRELFNAP